MQKRLKLCVLSVAALAAFSALAETRVVPPNDVQTIRADADAVLSDACYLRGTLQKLGSGKLTIPAERLYGTGRILVSEGALEITVTGSDTDPIASCAPAQGAALWFDAQQHVETDSAGVRRWFDVRETNWQQASFQTNYIYGLAMTNLAKNALSPQLIATNDCPYLYFGGGGSGQWMRWNYPDGTDAWIPVIHSFFVLNPLGTHAHYLGSSRNEDGYNCVFAVSTGATGLTYFCCKCGSPDVYNKVRCGGVWCDGVAVDPSATIDRTVPQVLETAACSRNGYGLIPSADCFFNFRNYQQSAGSYSNGDRVGGTGIHEAIVFTNALTETERVTVEQYLVRKWVKKGSFAACTPKVIVSKGATVTIAPALAAQISVVSDGCRVVSADEDVLATDPVTGPSGILSVGLGAFTNRAGFVVRSEPGRAYDVDALQTVTVAAGATGAFAKTGEGALAVDSLAEATAVTLAGETRLAAPNDSLATPAALTNNCVRDGGFEGISSTKSYQQYAKGASFGAWVSDSHYSSSATRVQYKTGWQYLDNTNCVPEGDYYMLLKWGGAAKQTVNLPADGRYAITLRCTPRTVSCAYARVSIDGFAIGTVQSRSGEPEWDMARLVTPALAKGEHVLSLSHDANSDQSIGIDDIRMTWLEPAEEQPVPNGNFEDVIWRSTLATDPSTADSNPAIQNTYFAATNSSPSFATLITNWTATGRAYFIRRQPYLRCAAGVTGTSWYGPANDNGCCSVALQAEKNSSKKDSDGIGGKITQSVKIEEDGWYRLSAKACQHDLTYDNFTLSGRTFNTGTLVLGLGDETETFTLTGHALLTRYEMTESVYFAKGAFATISLKVGDVTTEEAVDTIAVDDIRLERTRTYGNLLANPSFEVRADATGKQAPGWTVDANTADKQIFYKTDDLQSIYFSSREVVDGTGYLRLYSYQAQANTVSQSVTVGGPGVYRLGFWSSTRVSQGSPYNNLCPFDVSVLLGEAVVFTRRITPAAIDRYVRREYQMRLSAAGAYKVEFAAVPGDGTEDVSSMVDAVFFGRVAEDESADYGISGEAKVALADGATLALDYTGTNAVRRVRFNGKGHAGVISAETDPAYILGRGALSAKSAGLIVIYH